MSKRQRTHQADFLTCIPSFGLHLLSAYCVLGPLLGTGQACGVIETRLFSSSTICCLVSSDCTGGCDGPSFPAVPYPLSKGSGMRTGPKFWLVTLGKPLNLCVPLWSEVKGLQPGLQGDGVSWATNSGARRSALCKDCCRCHFHHHGAEMGKA